MSDNSSRRTFLRGGALLAAGAASTPALAMKPVERKGKSNIKLALAGYSFRKHLKDGDGPMTLLDFADLAADLDLDGIEPTSYYFPKNLDRSFVLELKNRAHRRGLEITGVPVRNVFTVPDGPERKKWVEHVRTWIDWAALLGAPTMRIFAGNQPKNLTLQQARENCVRAIYEVLDYAGEKGVFLALENHGGIVPDAENLLAVVNAINHPWFGINLDTGNFRTEDPYDDMMRCAPYAVAVQYKVEIRRKGQEKEPADIHRILQILRGVNYRGHLVLEYESTEDPLTAVPRYVKEIQNALHA